MKILCLILANVVIASAIFIGCSKSNDAIVNPPVDNNLVTNGSFELNGMPTLQGWSVISHDSSSVTSSIDVPPGGGQFSVRIKNEWTFGGAAYTTVPAFEGPHRYKLSAWGKSSMRTYGTSGSMSLLLQKADTLIELPWAWDWFPDTTWELRSFTVVLDATRGDSIRAVLQGNSSQFAAGFIFFDLCRLEKLD